MLATLLSHRVHCVRVFDTLILGAAASTSSRDLGKTEGSRDRATVRDTGTKLVAHTVDRKQALLSILHVTRARLGTRYVSLCKLQEGYERYEQKKKCLFVVVDFCVFGCTDQRKAK